MSILPVLIIIFELFAANYWLFLSVGQLFIIQFMLLAFLMIVSKVNSISAQESLKRSQKRGLWILLAAFELSAITNVTYHTFLFLRTFFAKLFIFTYSNLIKLTLTFL